MNDEKNNISSEKILDVVQKNETSETEGKLKIYIGMVAGVGKTYNMLSNAHDLIKNGHDVVAGLIDCHERPDTEIILSGIEIIPLKKINYKGKIFEELDVDAIINRKPEIVLIDELAHTNIPGSRNYKRYQDILEILKLKINVYTCLNIQHLESLSDIVFNITGVRIKETIPDSFLDRANEIVVIDIPVNELLRRLKDGKIYKKDIIETALSNFFKEESLIALREMALRHVVEKIDKNLRDYKLLYNINQTWKTGHRLMVGVFASPYSEGLIRWTRRMADSLGCSWVGAYIDTDTEYSDEEKKLLDKNLNFVKSLGGEIISTKDIDVVDGLLRIAKENSITQIIVGKSKNWKKLFYHKTLINRLLKESKDIDIYIVDSHFLNISLNESTKIPKKSIPIKKYDILISLGSLIIITLISFLLAPEIGYKAIGFLFLLNTTVFALYFNLGVVLSLSLLSSLVWNYIFIPPVYSFTIGSFDDTMMFFMNLITGAIICTLTSSIKKQKSIIEKREVETIKLYNFTKEISNQRTIDEIIQTTTNYLENLFNTKCCIYLTGNSNNNLITHNKGNLKINENDLLVARWAINNKTAAGRFTDTLNTSPYYFIPLLSSDNVYGVLAVDLSNNNELSYEQKILMNNIAGQTAFAIQKEKFNEIIEVNLINEKSNKLYKTILDSVSHELKTPLTIINGSASALMDNTVIENKEAVTNLINEINLAGKKMKTLIENLLDMSKIESNNLKIRLEPVDLKDLINVVINNLSSLPNIKNLIVDISDDIELINLDFVLMEQALRNIIQNSLIYSGDNSPIEVFIKEEKDSNNKNNLVIIIQDNGIGLPEYRPEIVFDKFYRADNKKSGGMGLGLTIAQSIIRLHGGNIRAENRKKGGAKFTVNIPV